MGLLSRIGGLVDSVNGGTVTETTDRRGVRHKSLVDGARQMLLQVARWLPDRRIIAVADSGFSAIDLPDTVRGHVCVVTRPRLDACLFAPAPLRRLEARRLLALAAIYEGGVAHGGSGD